MSAIHCDNSSFDHITIEQQRADLAEINLKTSKVSWEAQEESLKKNLDDLDTRFKDLMNQNNLLYTQLEQLSAQAVLVQRRNSVSELGEDSSKTNEEYA